jgi:hypothetical protein
MKSPVPVLAALCAAALATLHAADPLEPAAQGKIDARIATIKEWAADPVIVEAVKTRNANPPAAYADMTQEKWKSLSVLAPEVRSFTKNPAAEFLKSKKDDVVSEAFLSGSDGTKVAFLAKPSNWSHAGKAKQDDPMAGKVWQGAVEVDESSGAKQIQVAVPVLDGGKPIGVLVVGLNFSKLTGN